MVRDTIDAWNQRYRKGDYDYLRNPDVHRPIVGFMRDRGIRSFFDVGCYVGNLLACARSGDVGITDYLGLDISSEALSEAIAVFPEYQFVHGDFRQFTPDRYFEATVISGVCIYYRNDLEAVRLVERTRSKYLILQDTVLEDLDIYPNSFRAFRVLEDIRYEIPLAGKATRRRMLACETGFTE